MEEVEEDGGSEGDKVGGQEGHGGQQAVAWVD